MKKNLERQWWWLRKKRLELKFLVIYIFIFSHERSLSIWHKNSIFLELFVKVIWCLTISVPRLKKIKDYKFEECIYIEFLNEKLGKKQKRVGETALVVD